MLSNNEITEIVYRNFKIKQLIQSMIDYSIKDGSSDDLQSYILEHLLTFDNVRLNHMYENKKLRNFISQIIKNQRNSGAADDNTYYQKYLHIKDNNQQYLEIEDVSSYNTKLDIIMDYIDFQSEMVECVVYTELQLKVILSFTVLKKYFMSDLTGQQLADHLFLSRSTINMLIRFAKDNIINYWETKGRFLEEK